MRYAGVYQDRGRTRTTPDVSADSPREAGERLRACAETARLDGERRAALVRRYDAWEQQGWQVTAVRDLARYVLERDGFNRWLLSWCCRKLRREAAGARNLWLDTRKRAAAQPEDTSQAKLVEARENEVKDLIALLNRLDDQLLKLEKW